jgi:hypothetical protein
MNHVFYDLPARGIWLSGMRIRCWIPWEQKGRYESTHGLLSEYEASN